MTTILPMILVPLVQVANVSDATSITAAIKDQKMYSIENVNWPNEYPYKPKVAFKIAHNGTHIFLHFFVEEQEILAKTEEDNGEVWTDSCVEFFLTFNEGKQYYNAEFTCIGKALLGYRESRDKAEHGNKDVMTSIKRFSSLGNQTFDKKKGDHKWDLLVAIPATAYWKDDIKSFSGIEAKGNVYKCGDNLTVPHYISWSPIGTETPNFHAPQYFGQFKFE